MHLNSVHSLLPEALQHARKLATLSLLGLMLLLAACNAAVVTPVPEAAEAEIVAESAAAGVVTDIDPLPIEQTTGPVRVQIPEIGLDAP